MPFTQPPIRNIATVWRSNQKMHTGTTLLGVHTFLLGRGGGFVEFHHASASAQPLPQSGYWDYPAPQRNCLLVTLCPAPAPAPGNNFSVPFAGVLSFEAVMSVEPRLFHSALCPWDDSLFLLLPRESSCRDAPVIVGLWQVGPLRPWWTGFTSCEHRVWDCASVFKLKSTQGSRSGRAISPLGTWWCQIFHASHSVVSHHCSALHFLNGSFLCAYAPSTKRLFWSFAHFLIGLFVFLLSSLSFLLDRSPLLGVFASLFSLSMAFLSST